MLRTERGIAAETIAIRFLIMGTARKGDAPEPTHCHI
jgi:hypothetical protein